MHEDFQHIILHNTTFDISLPDKTYGTRVKAFYRNEKMGLFNLFQKV